MTLARPAGTYPAGPASLSRPIGRAPSFAAAGILCAINGQADQLISAFRYQTALGALSWLGGVSAVIWFALYAALKVGFEAPPERLSRADMAVLALAVALCFFPMSTAAVAGLLVTGGYLFISSSRDQSSRRLSLILLALTGPLLWGRLLLKILAAPILSLDAHIVGLVIGTRVQGNSVRFASSDQMFLIGGPCSSVHNISIAIVLWTVAAALFKIRIDRRYAAVGAAMIAFMFVLNIARLAAIGWFPDQFDLLHVGAGAALFGWAGLIGAALLAGFGVVDADARQQR